MIPALNQYVLHKFYHWQSHPILIWCLHANLKNVHTLPFSPHWMQLKIAMLLSSQLHNFSASFHPVAAVPRTYLNSRVSWSPECYSATKMASACRILVVFPVCLSFFPKTCILSSLFILVASNENLSDIPQPSLRLIHLSAPSSLWPHCSTGRWAWILIHVGESPCVFKRFCLSALLSPSLCRLSLSLSGFCFWPRYLKEILPWYMHLLHSRDKRGKQWVIWGKDLALLYLEADIMMGARLCYCGPVRCPCVFTS